MKLFIDTNIILDLLQYREPWINDTLVLFQLAKEDKVELIMSDLTFVNVVYIAGKNVDKKALKETLVKLKKFVKVVSIGDTCIEQALNGDSLILRTKCSIMPLSGNKQIISYREMRADSRCLIFP